MAGEGNVQIHEGASAEPGTFKKQRNAIAIIVRLIGEDCSCLARQFRTRFFLNVLQAGLSAFKGQGGFLFRTLNHYGYTVPLKRLTIVEWTIPIIFTCF